MNDVATPEVSPQSNNVILSFREIIIPFGISIALLILAWILMLFTTIPAIVLAIFCVVTLVFIIFGSLSFAHSRFAKTTTIPIFIRFAEFGRRLWHFPNLWFVVFLVGTYLAFISSLNDFAEHRPDVRSVSIYLGWAKDLISAGFLAVITSVIANTFNSIGDLGTKLNGTNTEINSTYGKISEVSTQVQKTFASLSVLSRTIQTVATTRQTAERIRAISDSAMELKTNNDDENMAEALLGMCDQVEKFHLVALHPLLAPGINPPKDGEDDTVVKISKRIIDYKDERPHYAYMSVAIGRYFETETLERQFPGVLLHVTSFAYYIKTIEKIVSSLESWYHRFEFYTVMPKSPINIFRFRNSSDFDEWIGFLEAFHDFHSNNKGVWKRIFAYSKGVDKQSVEFVDCATVAHEIKKGFVVTANNSWIPRKILSADLESFIPSSKFTKIDQENIRKVNQFHDGFGTLADSSASEHPEQLGWGKLKDVLLGYHGLNIDASDDEIADKFIFRCIDDCLDIFQKDVRISSRPVKGSDGSEKTIVRTFQFPSDFFAIRDKNKPDLDCWVFFIGFDDSLSNGRKSDVHLSFSPVLDLASMAASGINNDIASAIRSGLNKIFFDINESNTCKLSHIK